jgi:prepilin-type N-terminal cleavage/methylation domain-containing protein
MNATPTSIASRRGLSLIETMASLVVLSVMAAVSLPMIDGATDAYVQSSALRASTENVAYALDRCVRVLRTVPLSADAQGVGLTSVSATAVRLSDGRGIELSGTTLLLRDTTGSTAPLCTDVEEFQLIPLASDGVTNTTAQPGLTRRFNIKVRTSKVDLRTSAFIRVGALGI